MVDDLLDDLLKGAAAAAATAGVDGAARWLYTQYEAGAATEAAVAWLGFGLRLGLGLGLD